MPSLMLAAADMDPMQIAMVVIFIVAGFIKWLWETWQGKRAADTAAAPMVDPEEQRMRDEAWRRQTGQPPRAAPPAAAGDSWEELRKAWKELKETVRQPQRAAPSPAQPPPLRQPGAQPATPPPIRRGSVRADLTAAEAQLAAARGGRSPEPSALTAEPVAVASQAAAVLERRAESPYMTALWNLRGNPALMRQAVVLHEILGPPKALQSSSDPAI